MEDKITGNASPLRYLEENHLHQRPTVWTFNPMHHIADKYYFFSSFFFFRMTERTCYRTTRSGRRSTCSMQTWRSLVRNLRCSIASRGETPVSSRRNFIRSWLVSRKDTLHLRSPFRAKGHGNFFLFFFHQ